MTERYLDVNGTTLFVDDRGKADRPALVYVHGGPGMSCYDFMSVMGDRLAERLRVVGVDQRGILRSGPVGDQGLSTRTVVADLETVRDRLGLEGWTVLGHSAGGATALDYALWHPGAVTGVVFDCPCWDADSTDRYRLPVAAELLDRYGQHDAARRCRELAERPDRLTVEDRTHDPTVALGDHYQELYFHGDAARRSFEESMAGTGFGDETWARGASHAPLRQEMYVDRLPQLSELTVPSLLLRGRHDLVTSPAMVERYRESVTNGAVHVLDASGHFPYREEPEAYADLVVAFTEKAPG